MTENDIQLHYLNLCSRFGKKEADKRIKIVVDKQNKLEKDRLAKLKKLEADRLARANALENSRLVNVPGVKTLEAEDAVAPVIDDVDFSKDDDKLPEWKEN